MTVIVAGRVEFEGQGRVDGGVAAPALVVVLGADQLLVAHRGVEFFAGGAFAVPAGDLLVAQLAILGAVAVEAGAVRIAQALGPDAAIYDTDDDVFTTATDPAELIPQSAGISQAEEGRGGRSVEGLQLVRRHGQHALNRSHLSGLLGAQLSGEAVEAVGVAIQLLPATGFGKSAGVLAIQIRHVVDDFRAVRIDLLTLLGRGRLQSWDAPFVGNDWGIRHLDDIDAILRFAGRFVRIRVAAVAQCLRPGQPVRSI